MAGLVAALTAAGGDPDRERAVLADAYARYSAIGAAVPHRSYAMTAHPGAYFTDRLPAFPTDDPASERWTALADELKWEGYARCR